MSALEQWLGGIKLVGPEAKEALDAWDTWLDYLERNDMPLSGGFGPFADAMEKLRKALDA